jgi:quinol monooxygenase YgiN
VDVFVRFDAKPGQRERLRTEVLTIVEPTRAEPGCIEFHLFEEKNASGTLFIHSRWKDDAAIDTHLQLPHMKRFRAVLDDLVTNEVRALRTRQIA